MATVPVLVSGLSGVVLVAVATRWPAVLGQALAALGGTYALLLVVDEPPVDARAAGVAAGLVATGELVGWAHELGGRTRDEPGNAWRRPIWIAALVLGSLAVAWVLLALADLARLEGLVVEAIGALAALAVLLLLARAGERSAEA